MGILHRKILFELFRVFLLALVALTSILLMAGIVFLIFEPNKFVRFHALQSAIAFGGLSLAWMIALSLGPPGWVLAVFVLPPVSAVLWLVLMYKAYQGERFKVPIAGDMAEHRM